MSLLLLGRHLHLLVVDALLDDGVDLFESCPRVVLKQDLLLPLNPLLLLLSQILHLLLLKQALPDLFVGARVLGRFRLRGHRRGLRSCLGVTARG